MVCTKIANKCGLLVFTVNKKTLRKLRAMCGFNYKFTFPYLENNYTYVYVMQKMKMSTF